MLPRQTKGGSYTKEHHNHALQKLGSGSENTTHLVFADQILDGGGGGSDFPPEPQG